MNFRTVFDVTQRWPPLSLLYPVGFALIIALCIWKPSLLRGVSKTSQFRLARLLLAIPLTLVVVLAVYVAVTYSKELAIASADLRNGTYHSVEGPIMNYHPEPSEGHYPAHFEVSGHVFRYSRFNDWLYYTGPNSIHCQIREGLVVRIAYLREDSIIRLECAE